MLLALLIVPVAMSVGAATDLVRAIDMRNRLAQAADGAGLAVGGSVGLSETELQDLGRAYFDLNFPPSDDLAERSIAVSVTNEIVTVIASARMNTAFLTAFGVDTLLISTTAEITRESKGLEVVMVLDVTGSMNSKNKIGAMRDAAGDLVDIMFGGQTDAEKLKIGLVPFVTTVNIKTPDFSMAWIDQEAESQYHGTNFDLGSDGERVNHLDLFDDIDNTEWKGCVEARPEPYDTLDTPPNPNDPDTLWVPYFWPDEPDDESNKDYTNDYMDDGVDDDDDDVSRAERQRNWRKYDEESASIDETPMHTRGPNRSCGHPITLLTNNSQLLSNRVDELRPWGNGGTNIAQGLVWGWRLLSPSPPFSAAAPYNDPEVQKAIIVLTDGDNLVVNNKGHNRSDYTSYGFLREKRLGTNNRNKFRNKINAKVETLCSRIKAQGIRVYTITFKLNSNKVQKIFRECATDPTLYFDSPSDAELTTTFRSIAQDLSNLRVSR